MWILRHLFAIAVLPFTMAVLIPFWVARQSGTVPALGAHPSQVLLQIGGVCLLLPGAALFISSLKRFATEGAGTLAPWDPPRRLVVRGPYRYVRNPMITGLIFVLFAEALLLLSRPHFVWALTFLGINCIYIPLLEEPGLAARFGESYREYCRHVPRLLPRLRPWEPQTDDPAI